MKTKRINLNTEYIKGFVDGCLAEYEIGLGPFMNYLHDYESIVKIKEGKAKIEIAYAIETDDRDLVAYFEITEETSTEQFRQKVQLAAEEMIEVIRKCN